MKWLVRTAASYLETLVVTFAVVEVAGGPSTCPALLRTPNGPGLTQRLRAPQEYRAQPLRAVERTCARGDLDFVTFVSIVSKVT